MSEQPKGPSALAVKMAQIMAEVKRVQKTGRNNFHGYDYATEADLVAEVRSKLAARNIALFPSVKSHEAREITDNRNRINYLATVALDITIVDGDSGDMMTTTWVGQGIDAGDKGYYKAYTGAVKYFLMKTFLIDTGDDPEFEEAPPERHRNSTRKASPQRAQGRQQTPRKGSQSKPEVPKEAKEIFNLARAAVGDEEAAKWCKMLAGKRGVTSLARVPGSLLAGKLQELEAMSLEERSDYILTAIHAGSSTEHAPSPTTQPTARKSGVTDEAPTDGRGAKDGATLPHERGIPGIGGRR